MDETTNINCPHCGLSIDYYSCHNYLYCPKCKGRIEVEINGIVDEGVFIDDSSVEHIKVFNGGTDMPIAGLEGFGKDNIENIGGTEYEEIKSLKDTKTELTLDDLLKRGIIFADEEWDEETGDYWWVYCEDEDCTKAIEDIDEFVRNYNRDKKDA